MQGVEILFSALTLQSPSASGKTSHADVSVSPLAMS